MNDDEYKKIYRALGLETRLNKLKEEASELIVACCHLQDKKIKLGDLIQELADVNILTLQLIDLLNCEKEFQNCIDYKKVNFCDKFGAVDSE